ncbi:YciI family protein [Arthrobacter castelli]|uniref:YciI family protein n=1 Tax=Arthrobacter castelli TaxID=271431 RepID=UPI00047CABFB|nr:YciI family protein [Arthrobacter castelli]
MPYLIETFDSPERAYIRHELYQEHLHFLAESAGLLLACGAKLSDDGTSADGGIYVVDLETRKEAEAFIAQDPFSRRNLFREVRIRRWRKAYLNGECFL